MSRQYLTLKVVAAGRQDLKVVDLCLTFGIGVDEVIVVDGEIEKGD
jgi:hypothetical protein